MPKRGIQTTSWLKWKPLPIGTWRSRRLAPSVAIIVPRVVTLRTPGVCRGKKRIAIAPAIGSPMSHERSAGDSGGGGVVSMASVAAAGQKRMTKSAISAAMTARTTRVRAP